MPVQWQPAAIVPVGNRRRRRLFRPQPVKFPATRFDHASKISDALRKTCNAIASKASYFLGAMCDGEGETVMLRKTVIALFAVASIGMLAPGAASARGGGGGGGGGGHGGGMGGGGMHGGGFGGGGFHGGGFHGGGFHGGGFHNAFHHGRGFGVGAFGLGLGYGLYDPYDYYADYGYPYYADGDSYYDDGGCYVVRRRVHTPYGWRIRPVQVCG
jgi:hypothetical protein